MAVRGLLKCPDDFSRHKQFFIEHGLQIEIQKELMFNFMNVSAIQNNEKELVKIKKEIFKLMYPDVKSEEENLFEEAAKAIGKDQIVKMTTTGKPLKDIPANLRK